MQVASPFGAGGLGCDSGSLPFPRGNMESLRTFHGMSHGGDEDEYGCGDEETDDGCGDAAKQAHAAKGDSCDTDPRSDRLFFALFDLGGHGIGSLSAPPPGGTMGEKIPKKAPSVKMGPFFVLLDKRQFFARFLCRFSKRRVGFVGRKILFEQGQDVDQAFLDRAHRNPLALQLSD